MGEGQGWGCYSGGCGQTVTAPSPWAPLAAPEWPHPHPRPFPHRGGRGIALNLMQASVPDGPGWSADAGPAGPSLRDAQRP